MIKLVVTDMDGSLLNDAKELPDNFFPMLSGLHKRNVQFAVASGRQMYTLQHDLFPARDSLYFIAENGAYVAHGQTQLYLEALSNESVLELLDHGSCVADAYFILCGKNGAYVQDSGAEFLNEARKYFKKLEIVEDLTRLKDDILKVTLCDFRNAEFNSLPHFKSFAHRFKVTVGAERYLDITSLSANKGSALRQLQIRLGVTPQETLVFGDYLNDLEMLQMAHYSYAMKNAHPEILRAARFITQWDNNESGVVQTILEMQNKGQFAPAIIC